MPKEEKEDAKRKREEDDEEKDDDDEPVKKKSSEEPVLKKEKDEYYAELGTKEFKNNKTQKRVTVSSFKGNVNVQFREYYEKDGKMLPGKSGLSLSKDQFATVLKLADQIQAAITDLS